MGQKYVLLPELVIPQEPTKVLAVSCKQELHKLLSVHDPKAPIGIDTETTGLYPRFNSKKGETPFEIVAIGMYSPQLGSICIYTASNERVAMTGSPEASTSYPELLKDLMVYLIEHNIPLYTHNGYFDLRAIAGGIFNGLDDVHIWTKLNHANDSFWLAKVLGSDGFLGQRHDLKTIQVDCLGWPARGDAELSEWLKAHKLKKGEMWKAPRDILCHYCALDAQSTYMLTAALLDVAEKWPAIATVTKYFLAEVKMLIVNYYAGIPVDLDMLNKFIEDQVPVIEETTRKFFAVPEIAAQMTKRWEKFKADHPEPERYKKRRDLVEPPKMTKTGTVSARWLKWELKMQSFEPPEETVRWQQWRKKMDAIEEEAARLGVPQVVFNISSSTQMKQLMYEDLGYPVLVTKKDKKKGRDAEEKASVGKEAFPGFGAIGDILMERSKVEKQRSMAISWRDNTDPSTGLLYPGFKIPGTSTLRLAGSDGVNCQNPVKSRAFMDCLHVVEPWVLVQADFTALEAVLMGYVTQDPGYLGIYGPGAKPNDIYLYFMSYIPGLDLLTQECGYDRSNPTKESIKLLKKKYKNERNVAKIAVLSLSYGSGWKKLYQTFTNKKVRVNGKPITRELTKAVYDQYWEAFPGLKRFNEWCTHCWEKTGGYLISPLGLPIASCADKVFKLPNAAIQQSGHLFTMAWLYYLEQEMDAIEIEWYPYVSDFHDESILQVNTTELGKEETIKQSHAAMQRALDKANKELCVLGNEIPMTIACDSGMALTKFKIEDG